MTIKTINKTYKLLESNVYYSFVNLIDKSKYISVRTGTKSVKFKAPSEMNDKFIEVSVVNGHLVLVELDSYQYSYTEFSLTVLIEILNQISK